MRRLSQLTFVFLIASLALTGFGCKKTVSQKLLPGQVPAWLQQNLAKPVTNVASTPSGAVSSTSGSSYESWLKGERTIQDESVKPDVLYLRQVMRNFTQVNSFRAHMLLPVTEGTLSGEVEFVRVKGLHGTLTLTNAPTTEVYLIGTAIYLRSNTSTWLNLSHEPQGENAVKILNSVFNPSANPDNKVVPEFVSKLAKIESVSDDPRGCKMYLFSQYNAFNGDKQIFQVCVKNDLPMVITSLSPDGKIEIEYRDYNKWIDLNPPI